MIVLSEILGILGVFLLILVVYGLHLIGSSVDKILTLMDEALKEEDGPAQVRVIGFMQTASEDEDEHTKFPPH